MIKKMKKEQLLIGLLLGIFLLIVIVPMPEKKENEETLQKVPVLIEKETAESVELQLENVLQVISGVGKVKVFIRYRDSGKVVVEKDEAVSEELVQEADSNGGARTTTTSRNEKTTVYDSEKSPYVIQELAPAVEGILVVAEGAGNVSVKKQIQEAIEALFGLDAHKISIMKMEVSK